MTDRHFSSPGNNSTTPGTRHSQSWAELYTGVSWCSSSESDRSGNSPDQSNAVDPDPPVSSSSHSSRASPADTNHRNRASSLSSPADTNHRNRASSSPMSVRTERQVVFMAPSTSRTRRATTITVPCTSGDRPRPNPVYSQGHSSSRVRYRPQSRRSHHGRRLLGHLPVAIPPDHWYTGVGSVVCAQCRLQRRSYHTSWMCLECRVPLCLLTWRNCYSQWHSRE